VAAQCAIAYVARFGLQELDQGPFPHSGLCSFQPGPDWLIVQSWPLAVRLKLRLLPGVVLLGFLAPMFSGASHFRRAALAMAWPDVPAVRLDFDGLTVDMAGALSRRSACMRRSQGGELAVQVGHGRRQVTEAEQPGFQDLARVQ